MPGSQRGVGWTTEPPTSGFAEATTSEVMRIDRLAITRDAGLTVLVNGRQVSDDGRTAVFTAPAARDTMVAVGGFRTAQADAGGVPVLVGVAPEIADEPQTVAAELARAVQVHARRFGAFPYEQLVTAVVPDLRGGVEHPGGILLGAGQTDDATGSHEVAHEWFYGLLGDDQARDPWLDESFATYAEALDRGTGASYAKRPSSGDARNRVGAPMSFWEQRLDQYYRGVYLAGATALLQARDAAGQDAFDEALRCHLRRNAHSISTPAGLAASLRHLPAALAVPRRAGALL